MARRPSFTLLVPGLAADLGGVDTSVLPELPALSLLLNRADRLPADGRDLDALLCGLFGVAPAADADPPVAALTWLADFGTPAARSLLRADPVHLRVDASGLLLFGPEVLRLEAEEADALLETLNANCADRGWHFHRATPHRWYLAPPDAPQIRTCNPAPLCGRDVSTCLPAGAHAGEWNAALNDIQMLLHDHPVNRRRREQGRPVVSGIWPWGGGSLPEPSVVRRWTRVWTDHPLAMGLAQHHAVARADVPDTAASLDAPSDGDQLVVLDDLCPDIARRDIVQWMQCMESLESAWIEPLLQRLRRGRIAALTLRGVGGHGFRLRRRHLLRLWRRRPFHVLL